MCDANNWRKRNGKQYKKFEKNNKRKNATQD